MRIVLKKRKLTKRNVDDEESNQDGILWPEVYLFGIGIVCLYIDTIFSVFMIFSNNDISPNTNPT